jgi:hypothetical protein
MSFSQEPDMFQDNEGNMFVKKNNAWVRAEWVEDERGRILLRPVKQEVIAVPYSVDDRVLTRGKVVSSKPIQRKPVSMSRHYKTVETGAGQHKQYVETSVGQYKQYAETGVGSQSKETTQQGEQTSWWNSLFSSSTQTQSIEDSNKEITVHYIPVYREKPCKPCKPCKHKSPKRKSSKRMTKIEKLRNKNMEQLLRQAKRLNITGRHSLKKEELVQKIRRKI